MFSPQDVKEKTFTKAVFGGYDMQSVDDFLEPLTADYAALYGENAELKKKLRVLVGKLEELRDRGITVSGAAAAQSQAAADALQQAQAKAEAMLRDTKRQCDAMLADARQQASQFSDEALVAQENQRLAYAKKTAQNFIEVVEKDIRGHLALLEKLKAQDLLSEQKSEPHASPYDYERENADKIVSEIDTSLRRMGITDEQSAQEKPAAATDERPTVPFEPTIRFEKSNEAPSAEQSAPQEEPQDQLQFGRNYSLEDR